MEYEAHLEDQLFTLNLIKDHCNFYSKEEMISYLNELINLTEKNIRSIENAKSNFNT